MRQIMVTYLLIDKLILNFEFLCYLWWYCVSFLCNFVFMNFDRNSYFLWYKYYESTWKSEKDCLCINNFPQHCKLMKFFSLKIHSNDNVKRNLLYFNLFYIATKLVLNPLYFSSLLKIVKKQETVRTKYF